VNQLVLKEMNDNRIIYFYHPNGEETFGEIEYLFAEKQARIARKADNDESGYFAHKATRKVEECVGKNNLPLNLTQAWY
jgi:hypothetical protein